MTRDRPRVTLPAVDPPATGTGEARVAGVLLAAGTSTRFGDENKLLADVRGEPLVRRSARALAEGGLGAVYVVVGHEAEGVRDALAGLDVTVVANPEYESGQASSVRAGVDALRDAESDWDAGVFALGDMPDVSPRSVRALVDAYEAGTWSALAAGFEGERGNPVLFDAAHFGALAAGEGDTGGRDVLLSAEDAVVVETGDPGVRRDVNRPEDLS